MFGSLWYGSPRAKIVGHQDQEFFPQHVAHWRALEDRVMRTREAVRNQRESLTIASGQHLEVDRVPYWQGRSVAGVIVCARDLADHLQTDR